MVVAMMAGFAALLLCLFSAHAHLLLRLSLDVLDKFGDSHAVLFSVDSKLALHCLDLLWRWSLSRLRHGDLTRPRLRAGLRRWSRHVEKSMFKKSVLKRGMRRRG
jgi:hypothetical protein